MVSTIVLGVATQASAQDFSSAQVTAPHTNATTHHEFDDTPEISPHRLYGGLWLGFAGESKLHEDTYRQHGASTVGGQFGFDVVGFHDLLSLGGEMRFGAAKSKAGERSNLIDLALKPRMRLVPGANCPLEFYLTAPIGITIPRFSDDSAEASANVGWNFGLGGGMNLFLHESFGINVEPMWLTHRFKVDGNQGSGKLTIQEFALFLNAVIAL